MVIDPLTVIAPVLELMLTLLLPAIAKVFVPVPPPMVSDPKVLVDPWVAVGATNPVNDIPDATMKVTTAVLETVSESVAVTVS